MTEPRFPVEPLSERRWQDVKRNVLAQSALLAPAQPEAPSTTGRGPIGLGLGLAAVAAIALFATLRPAPTTTSASLSRMVTDGSTATTTAGDATVSLAAHTSVLVIEPRPDAWLVSLESGSAHFDVPPRRDRPAFTVEAGRTRVQVVGTAFTVTRDPGAPSARVEVDHGTVRVTDGSTDVLLHDGERWPPGLAVAAPTRTSTDGTTPSTDPPTAPASATSHAARIRPPPAPTSSSSVAPAPRVEPTPSAEPGAPTARDRYRAAEARESSDPAAALAIYAELASQPGPWNAPALMSAARLEAELGHRDRARALAERYLADHPDGINAEDARDLLRR